MSSEHDAWTGVAGAWIAQTVAANEIHRVDGGGIDALIRREHVFDPALEHAGDREGEQQARIVTSG